MRSISSIRASFVTLLALVVAPLSGLPLLSQTPARTAELIWMGQCGGRTVRWTSANITASAVSDPAKILFSAKKMAQEKFKEFEEVIAEHNPDAACSYTLTLRLLSVVGSIMIYEENEYSYCREKEGVGWPHPANETNYRVVDLNQPTRRIELTDFLSEDEILRALLADPLVKRALEGSRSSNAPKTIRELVVIFEEEGLSLEPLLGTREVPKGCTFLLPEDVLSQFSFHHLENAEVALRIQLRPNVGACRTANAQLGIKVPIPEVLKNALARADGGKEGFLMENARRIAGGRVTSFRFRTGPIRKRPTR